MQILLTAATPFEVLPLAEWLQKNCTPKEAGVFEKNNLRIVTLTTGVGVASTCWQLGAFFARHRPDLALNAGIAGAFDRNLDLGAVLNVTTERFGDLGVEEADGRFTDLFELGLAGADEQPFSNGVLRNPDGGRFSFLPEVEGITVNKVHGWQPAIEAILAKYPHAQVESMEGAAFFYACLLANIPFLEIRSISNYVEPRNREAWNLPLAIENLNKTLIGMLDTFANT